MKNFGFDISGNFEVLLVFSLLLSIVSAKFYFSNDKNISLLNKPNAVYANVEKNEDGNGEQIQIVEENLWREFDILLKSDNFITNYKMPSKISAISIDEEKYFSDNKPKNLYRLIVSCCLPILDWYNHLDYETKQKYKKNYEEYLKENQNNFYYVERYARYKIDKVAIYYYEKFLRDLIEKPDDWQNIWKKFRIINIEHLARADTFNIDPEARKYLLLTSEDKELAKKSNVPEEQIKKEIEKDRNEYPKILEKKRKEMAEELDKWKREYGIIE